MLEKTDRPRKNWDFSQNLQSILEKHTLELSYLMPPKNTIARQKKTIWLCSSLSKKWEIFFVAGMRLQL